MFEVYYDWMSIIWVWKIFFVFNFLFVEDVWDFIDMRNFNDLFILFRVEKSFDLIVVCLVLNLV